MLSDTAQHMNAETTYAYYLSACDFLPPTVGIPPKPLPYQVLSSPPANRTSLTRSDRTRSGAARHNRQGSPPVVCPKPSEIPPLGLTHRSSTPVAFAVPEEPIRLSATPKVTLSRRAAVEFMRDVRSIEPTTPASNHAAGHIVTTHKSGPTTRRTGGRFSRRERRGRTIPGGSTKVSGSFPPPGWKTRRGYY